MRVTMNEDQVVDRGGGGNQGVNRGHTPGCSLPKVKGTKRNRFIHRQNRGKQGTNLSPLARKRRFLPHGTEPSPEFRCGHGRESNGCLVILKKSLDPLATRLSKIKGEHR